VQDNKAAAGTHSPSREACGMALGGYGRECVASAAGRLIPAAGRRSHPGPAARQLMTGPDA